GGLQAFKFYGPNTSYDSSGYVGGGYFILPPGDTPYDQLYPYRGEFGAAAWYLYDFGAAIDNSLADSALPYYLDGDELVAENYQLDSEGNSESAVTLRYGPIGDPNYLNIYTESAPPITNDPSLGDVVTSHPWLDLAGGQAGRGTYVDGPVVQPFSIDEVFK